MLLSKNKNAQNVRFIASTICQSEVSSLVNKLESCDKQLLNKCWNVNVISDPKRILARLDNKYSIILAKILSSS